MEETRRRGIHPGVLAGLFGLASLANIYFWRSNLPKTPPEYPAVEVEDPRLAADPEEGASARPSLRPEFPPGRAGADRLLAVKGALSIEPASDGAPLSAFPSSPVRPEQAVGDER